MAYLIVLVVIALAVSFISAPLRAARGSREADRRDGRLAELRAARDAKYSEIRDAELDMETGKLSADDYAAIDGSLRTEAIAIMHELDALEAAPSATIG